MIRILLILGFVLSVSLVSAQKRTESPILSHVTMLSSDSLRNRGAGSDNERLTNKYLRSSWVIGKKTSFYSWEYFLKDGSDSIASEMVGTFLYNKSKATILLCADLENSSDVACLVGLQNTLAKMKLDVNVMVVSVTGKNGGHQGLDYLADHMPKKSKDIRLVIYLNDVGRMNRDNPQLSISATNGILEELIVLTKQFQLVKLDDSSLLEGATKNYFKKGIQSLTVSTPVTENPINSDSLNQVRDFLVQWISTK